MLVTNSKRENDKYYPSIEIIIYLSDLFGIAIDEMLRSDEVLEEKVTRDSRKLAYPKWKAFFDSVFLLGVFLLVLKLVMAGLNHFVGTNIIIPEGLPKILSNFLPLVLMLTGGVGSDQLKTKYID